MITMIRKVLYAVYCILFVLTIVIGGAVIGAFMLPVEVIQEFFLSAKQRKERKKE